MLLDPNREIFQNVPTTFQSPFASNDSRLSEKYQAISRAAGDAKNLISIGERLLCQQQAQAWRDGVALVNYSKAVVVGDILVETLPKVAWISKGGGPAGLFAKVPFPQTTNPEKLGQALASVALDVAIKAISSVPIVGQILGAVVQVALFIYRLFTAPKESEPELMIPWATYSDRVDEEIVKNFLWQYFAQNVDWTAIWLPPYELAAWELHKAARDGKEYKGGQVWAPLLGGEIPYAQGQLGCIPNTVRVAGHLQRIPGGAPVEALRRHWLAWGEISWGGIVTNVGDFFPSTGQVAGGMWKQAERPGNPDMYKVDARAIKSAWEDYFGQFFDSGFSLYKSDASIGELLAPYICVVLDNQPRLGIPNLMRPHPAPFVTPSIFKQGPGMSETRTDCLFVEEDLRPWRYSSWSFSWVRSLAPAGLVRCVPAQGLALPGQTGDLYRCQGAAAVRRRANGTGIVLLTATPAKNSPLEFYNLIQLIDPHAFTRRGLMDPEQFIDRFLQIESRQIIDITLKVATRSVVDGFKNLDDLRTIIETYGEFVSPQKAGLVVPEPRSEQIIVEMNDEQEERYAELVGEIEQALRRSRERGSSSNAILGLLARLSLYALHPKLGRGIDNKEALTAIHPEDYAAPKLLACAERVAASPGCGHIIFCEPTAVHQWLREVLVSKKIPRERIAILSGATKPAERNAIANRFNGIKVDPPAPGACGTGQAQRVPPTLDVLIANSVANEGLDLQFRTCGLHHLDLPWTSSDLEQRNGRGVRQGNENSVVQIFYYLSARSMDWYRYQLIQGKRAWLSAVLESQARDTSNPGAQKSLSDEEILLMISRDRSRPSGRSTRAARPSAPRPAGRSRARRRAS
jgi:hypothetical protein